MSLLQNKNVNFGKSRSGLSTVGYTLLDTTGSVVLSRTTSGVYELTPNSGLYACNITFPDNFHGSILWDTGQISTLIQYATEQYNYEENNPKVDDIWNVEYGRWRIINNQMIFYKPDGITEISRFDLFDENGSPTMSSPFERRKV